jgi:iron complex transport system ATP-binding protein
MVVAARAWSWGMIAAQGVSYRTGSNWLLESVSLEVRPNELLAVVGPNGAGKSTLLKVLAGELVPTAGQLFLHERQLQRWKPLELAKHRAVLPQDSSLEFAFTAFEVVLLGRNPFIQLRESRHDLEVVKAALKMTATDHLSERLYPTLSGGERQRVQLARVLAQVWGEGQLKNRFLLLDEPVSSLDVLHQHETLAVAKGLAQAGVGVLAVLHDLGLAAAYADRMAVLSGGRLLVCDTPRVVLNSALIRNVFGVSAEIRSTSGVLRVDTMPFAAREFGGFV